MVLDDGRDIERYVSHIEGGMIHCEDGTSFHDAQVVKQWVRWADLPADEQTEYRY